jgi:hypothetical protein
MAISTKKLLRIVIMMKMIIRTGYKPGAKGRRRRQQRKRLQQRGRRWR